MTEPMSWLHHKLYRLRFNAREWFPHGRFPVHIDLELAGKCQLACVMCPYGDGSFDTSKQGMMPTDLAMEALEQAAAGGVQSVKLNFRGEPGLSRDLETMVRRAKVLGFQEVSINTNLTAFSKRRLAGLCRAGLDLLIVSIDGATAEIYESIRINGDFDNLCNNLRHVSTIESRPRIRVQMVVQDGNRHEVDLMRERFGPLCDELIFQQVRQDNSGERKRCPQPWQRLVIMWDGQVGACCSNWNNEAIIGKFPEQSLQQIWNSQKRQDLLHYAADPNRGGPCKGCLVGGSYR